MQRALLCVGTIVVGIVLACSGPVLADDRDTCKKSSGDTAIEACSRAIASKKYSGHALSLLHTNRGVEYSAKDENDRAINDHKQAIRLDPRNALAYNNLGKAYSAKGDDTRAIADYDQAIRLNPKYAVAFYNRGLAKQKKGDKKGGDADIANAKRLQPNIGQ